MYLWDTLNQTIYIPTQTSAEIKILVSQLVDTYILSGAPISWMSKQQKEVALSSMESEYYADGYAIQEATWVDSLLEELKMNH